jgi:hypothetical protein
VRLNRRALGRLHGFAAVNKSANRMRARGSNRESESESSRHGIFHQGTIRCRSFAMDAGELMEWFLSLQGAGPFDAGIFQAVIYIRANPMHSRRRDIIAVLREYDAAVNTILRVWRGANQFGSEWEDYNMGFWTIRPH